MFRVCRRPTAGPERVPAVDATGIRYSNGRGASGTPFASRRVESRQRSRVASGRTAQLARGRRRGVKRKQIFCCFLGLRLLYLTLAPRS